MPPNMRFVVSLVYFRGFTTSMTFGFCLYGYWELANFYPKWKRNTEKDELMKQRYQELVSELRRTRAKE